MGGWKDRKFYLVAYFFCNSIYNRRMQDIITSTLEAYGERGGYSAMARTVGVPCGIAVQLILDGEPALTKPGVHAPYTKEVCDPLREKLEGEGIGMVERVL